MAGQRSDADLVRASLRGDSDAFAELAGRHWDRVYAIAYSKTMSHMDAADVAQETFLRAYTRLGQMQRLDVFRAWVCRIAWSSSLDTLRRRFREAPADKDDIWAGLPAEEDLHAATERALDAQRVLAPALRSLPDSLRTPLVMRYVAEASYEAIAESLCISVTNAQTRVTRAKQRIKEHFARVDASVSAEDTLRSMGVAGPVWAGLGSMASNPPPAEQSLQPPALACAAAGTALTVGILVGGGAGSWGGVQNESPAGPAFYAVTATSERAAPLMAPWPRTVVRSLVLPGSEWDGWEPAAPQNATELPTIDTSVYRSPPAGAVVSNDHGVLKRIPASEGVLTIEMWMRPPLGAANTLVQLVPGGHDDQAFSLVFKNETNRWGYAPEPRASEFFADVDAAGHDLKLVYTTATATWDIHLDGKLMAEGVSSPRFRGVPITGVILVSGRGGRGLPLHFDDLSVTVRD